jgi:hypothetical protein
MLGVLDRDLERTLSVQVRPTRSTKSRYFRSQSPPDERESLFRGDDRHVELLKDIVNFR